MRIAPGLAKRRRGVRREAKMERIGGEQKKLGGEKMSFEGSGKGGPAWGESRPPGLLRSHPTSFYPSLHLSPPPSLFFFFPPSAWIIEGVMCEGSRTPSMTERGGRKKKEKLMAEKLKWWGGKEQQLFPPPPPVRSRKRWWKHAELHQAG